MAQALLFDLDGTLIDSSDDLTRALNAAFAEHGLGALSREQVEPLIGQGAQALIERALQTSGQRHLVADSDLLLASFSQRSHEIYDLGRSSTRAHRFALEALRELKSMGVALALVTNKGRELSVKALRKINAEPFFTAIVGGDTCPRRKPDPMPLQRACELLGVELSSVCMVGDSLNDVRAARAAGIPVWCVSHGYREGLSADNLGADMIVELHELPALVRARRLEKLSSPPLSLPLASLFP
jgi:phosphoglycolate phosphatase